MAQINGVEIVLPDVSVLRSEERPSVWVDSCVFLDFFSEISLNKNATKGPVSIEVTRQSMQDAAWCVVALDEVQARTVTFLHEVWDNNMKVKAAPDTPAGVFPAIVAHVVLDHVCPGWRGHVEFAGANFEDPTGTRVTSNDERDQLMVDLCREHGMHFISTDKKARHRARVAEVTSWKPAVYAATIIDRASARVRFLERLELGLSAWLRRHDDIPHGPLAVRKIRELYTEIWRSPRRG